MPSYEQDSPGAACDGAATRTGQAGTRPSDGGGNPDDLMTFDSPADRTPVDPIPGSLHGDLGRVRTVIDALPEAVVVTDPDGRVRHRNQAAERLFAGDPVRDRADLLSRFEVVERGRVRPRILAPNAGTSRVALTVRPRGQPNRWFALRTVTLDGSPINGVEPEYSTGGPGAPEPHGPPIGLERDDAPDAPQAAGEPENRAGSVVFFLRDVTDSPDLGPLREAFVGVLSHELRTPITTIFAGTSVLARSPALSQPATRTLARDISAEAARLYDLVEDFLVLARLERHVLDPIDEPVRIDRIIDSIVRMTRSRVGGPAIERRGDARPPSVHGDATYVEQACRNLVLAASRASLTARANRIVVDVRTDSTADEVLVTILDRGPSLASEDLERAFELPDDGRVSRLTGSGIGLFVARHLVESMGGRVWVQNRPGGGLETGFALRVHTGTAG